MDLSYCTFSRSTNLDRLRLEAGTTFLNMTGRFRTKRRVIAQECIWRYSKNRRWKGPTGIREGESRPRGSDKDWGIQATEISEIYRALRKGREDNKDEPGAADFYYGEMEMRRLSSASTLAERLLLTAYSGDIRLRA